MIGQKEVLKQIDNLIEKGFPRFIVITGQKGQGKTELAKYIFQKLDEFYATPEPDNRGGIYMVEIEPKIDAIREMIEMSYKQTEPIIYLIQNADKMSIGAKNSLLKVIEEPPNNAYFIMELQQIENTLETIKSRCQEIKMESYTEEELEQMLKTNNLYTTDEEKTIIQDIASNKYQIDLLVKYKPREFYDYVDKVYENIYKVQSANSFKLAERVDLKDTGEGYDLEMFWNIYIYRCYIECYNLTDYEMNNEDLTIMNILYECIKITEKYKQKLNINGINKQSLVDMWILDIRKEWRK